MDKQKIVLFLIAVWIVGLAFGTIVKAAPTSIIVQSYTQSDSRTTIFEYETITVHLHYNDATHVTDGSVTINNVPATNLGSGNWRINQTSASVRAATYNTVAASGNSEGVTTVNQNGQSATQIWDRVVVENIVANDTRASTGKNVRVTFDARYDYDNASFTSGGGSTILINGTAATYISGNDWRVDFTNASVGNRTYLMSGFTDNVYGLTKSSPLLSNYLDEYVAYLKALYVPNMSPTQGGYRCNPDYNVSGSDYFNYWTDDAGKIMLAMLEAYGSDHVSSAEEPTLAELKEIADFILYMRPFSGSNYLAGRYVNSSMYSEIGAQYYNITNRIIGMYDFSKARGYDVYEWGCVLASVIFGPSDWAAWYPALGGDSVCSVLLSDVVINGTQYFISTGAEQARYFRSGANWISFDRKLELTSTYDAYCWFNVTLTAGKDYADIKFRAFSNGSTYMLNVTDVGFGFGSMNEFLQYNPRYIWTHLTNGTTTWSEFNWFTDKTEHHAWTSYDNGGLVDLIGVTGYRTPEVAKGYIVLPLNATLMREVNYLGEKYGNGTRIVYSPQYASPQVSDIVPAGGAGKIYRMLCVPLTHVEYDLYDSISDLVLDDAASVDNYDLAMPASVGIAVYAMARYANILPLGIEKHEYTDYAIGLWNFYYNDVKNRIDRVFYRSSYALACAGLELDPTNATYLGFAADVLNYAFRAQIMDSDNPEYGLTGWSLEDHGWLYLCAKLYNPTGSNATITTRSNLISAAIQHDSITQEIYMNTLNDGAYNTTGIAAWWQLDEVQNDTIYDYTSYSHIGTVYGATRTDGKFRRCLEFGAGDYATVANYVGDMPTSSLDITGPITLEAWVYPTTFSGVNRILTKDGDVYVLRLEGGSPHFYIKVGGSLYHARGDTDLPLNSWTHIAATWQNSTYGSDQYLRIYLNGTETTYASQDWVNGTMATSSGAVTLGNSGAEAYLGKMDQIRLWNRVLNSTELTINYEYGPNENFIHHASNALTGGTIFRAAELIYGFMSGGFSETDDLSTTCINLFLTYGGEGVDGYEGKAFGRPAWRNSETHSDCLAACLVWMAGQPTLEESILAVIWDRVRLLTLTTPSATFAPGSTVTVWATAELEYDGHDLGAGDSFTLNDDSANNYVFTWDSLYSKFKTTRTEASAIAHIIDGVTSASEASYGITSGTMNGHTLTLTWTTAMPTFAFDALWQNVLSGDFLGLVIAIYQLQMGEYFLGFVLLMLAVPLYIRTQSLTYCFLMWLLLMPLCLAFLPVAAEKIVGMMLVLALGGLLFEAIGKFSTYTRS